MATRTITVDDWTGKELVNSDETKVSFKIGDGEAVEIVLDLVDSSKKSMTEAFSKNVSCVLTIGDSENEIEVPGGFANLFKNWLNDSQRASLTGETTAKSTNGGGRGTDSTNKHGFTPKEVREWAKETGHKIDGQTLPSRGKVSQAWYDARRDAQ